MLYKKYFDARRPRAVGRYPSYRKLEATVKYFVHRVHTEWNL